METEQLYKAIRYFKNTKKPLVMKYDLTLEGAREFCRQYKSTNNSFVGFIKQ